MTKVLLNFLFVTLSTTGASATEIFEFQCKVTSTLIAYPHNHVTKIDFSYTDDEYTVTGYNNFVGLDKSLANGSKYEVVSSAVNNSETLSFIDASLEYGYKTILGIKMRPLTGYYGTKSLQLDKTTGKGSYQFHRIPAFVVSDFNAPMPESIHTHSLECTKVK